ncbi:MAG: hypothetical protein DIU80_007645 [Chloroflexota bacterium]|nr:MAG: hypothetical protein DIU80_11205 [Chloroflexota bacterium]
MTSQPAPSDQITNQVIAVGTLDRQWRNGRESTRIASRNALHGHEEQIVIQVPSPFGRVYALPLRLDGTSAGSALLEQAQIGTRLRVTGRLVWSQRSPARHAGTERTSQPTGELAFCVSAVGEPTPDDEPGCDVWLSGVVIGPARVVRHPQKRALLLAQTALRVSVERQRRGSRARLVETERVPVVVPLDHPDAPNLLRPGNEVRLEGMLERVLVTRRGPEVDQALAALDAEWHAQRAGLEGQAEALRAAERRYLGRRRSLTEVVHSRVVAGYVELISGAPATLREVQAMRQASLRSRSGHSEQPPADAAAADSE